MAAVDYFLKIEGIDGESTDDKHKGTIDIESWSWGVAQQGTHSGGGGGGAGKAAFSEFSCTTTVSKASPKLMLACANGEHIKKAVLTVRKAGKEQQEYLVITLSDLLVSSYNVGDSPGGDVAVVDAFTLNYSKIEMEYKEQKADGSLGGAVKAGYDVKANKKV
jgi:type VI secretion system secreted protein Hcp